MTRSVAWAPPVRLSVWKVGPDTVCARNAEDAIAVVIEHVGCEIADVSDEPVEEVAPDSDLVVWFEPGDLRREIDSNALPAGFKLSVKEGVRPEAVTRDGVRVDRVYVTAPASAWGTKRGFICSEEW